MREKLFSLAQDRSLGISARMRKILKEFGVEFQQKSFAEWLELLLSLEIMDGTWESLLSQAEEVNGSDEWETEWEQLLVYFIYRHVSDPERDIRKGIFFSVLSVYMIRKLFAYLCKRDGKADFDSLVELCRLYSSEIEYSEENTECLSALISRRSGD